MAASVQDHFHLVDSAAPGDAITTDEWKAMAPNFLSKDGSGDAKATVGDGCLMSSVLGNPIDRGPTH